MNMSKQEIEEQEIDALKSTYKIGCEVPLGLNIRTEGADSLSEDEKYQLAIAQVSISSSNERVATVNNHGVIFGLSKGTTIITAASENGVTSEVEVEIYE